MSRPFHRLGFTLLELLMALAGAAMILSAIYGVYSKAMHLRDQATARLRETRVLSRAAAVIRNDLRNAIISGGKLAATLQTRDDEQASGFAGHLRFTTTTGRDTADELLGDVQEVDYSVTTNEEARGDKSGVLVRKLNRTLLAETRTILRKERLLTGVESMQVSFFDGNDWVETWEVTNEATDLPLGVRLRIYATGAAQGKDSTPLIEVVVPWSTQREIPLPASTTTPAATARGSSREKGAFT